MQDPEVLSCLVVKGDWRKELVSTNKPGSWFLFCVSGELDLAFLRVLGG